MKMKKSILALMLGATFFGSCDIERFPTYNMSD